MTIAHIFRHGETEWNERGLMQGHMDSRLNENGKRQAEKASDIIREIEFDVAITSSSSRAVETASILLKGRKTEIIPDDDLREIHLGVWEGREKSKVEMEHKEQYQRFWHSPLEFEPMGGESFAQLWERVTSSMLNILETYAGNSILIVSHAASVKAMMSFFAGRTIDEIWEPPSAENLSHSVIEKNGKTIMVHKFCGENWMGVIPHCDE